MRTEPILETSPISMGSPRNRTNRMCVYVEKGTYGKESAHVAMEADESQVSSLLNQRLKEVLV